MTKYQTNFTAEDFTGDDTGDDDVKVSIAEDSKKKSGKKSAEEAPATAGASASGSEVPEGTTAEILSWVGDDKEKAQAALDKENADDKPRKGLVGELEEILTEPEDETEPVDAEAETEDESKE